MVSKINSSFGSNPIAVTGATGYIGSALLKMLRALEHPVIGLSRVDGDIAGNTDLTRLIEDQSLSMMYHLAGAVGVQESWNNPQEFYRVNVLGTQRMLEVCRRTGARMVYVSGYLYAGHTKEPATEDADIKPMNPYAHSKFLAEEMCRFYSANHKVHCTIIRPFNVYGGQQSAKFLIPQILEQIRAPGRTILVNDLEPIRDYLYIDDLISALIALLGHKHLFEIFNIGTGVGHSVGEVANLMQAVWGTQKEVSSREIPRLNEISVSVANVEKIRSQIGWQASFSLKKGLRTMFSESSS
jgi:nucleoside-diphosphate-sugar epimerase